MIQVFDEVLAGAEKYRTKALKQPFQSVTIGKDTFHGIGHPPDAEFAVWMIKNFPEYEPTLSFLRKSPEGQQEPNFIHSDEPMGDLTAILFLNPEPAKGDGTSFYNQAGSQFLLDRTVEAKFNRAVVFSAEIPHSRAIEENYGEGNDARLIQVLFASKVKQEKPSDK